jgi:aminopeptidase-like protein
METFEYKRNKAITIRTIEDYANYKVSQNEICHVLYRNLSESVQVEIDGVRLAYREWTHIGMEHPGCRVNLGSIDIRFYIGDTNTPATTDINCTISTSTISNIKNIIIPCQAHQ